jgi:heme/copper-type cytochrome/quinol oxidase subunit 3
MQTPSSYVKKIMPFFAVFILINCMLLVFQQRLMQYKIDAAVVFGANCILFFLSSINIAMHCKALENKNPNVVIRSIMMATMMKLLVVAISVVSYVMITGEKRNTYAVLSSMILYLIYTVIESRIAMKLKNKNGNN